MRHYLSEQEFRESIMFLTENRDEEFILHCEDDLGEETAVEFISVHFHWNVILYTYPMTADIGLMQSDIDNGWDDIIHNVWTDITDQCGYRPYEDYDEEIDELPFDRNGRIIHKGDLVLWYDPDEEARDLGNYWNVDSIRGEIVYITCGYSEAEVYPHELEIIDPNDY